MKNFLVIGWLPLVLGAVLWSSGALLRADDGTSRGAFSRGAALEKARDFVGAADAYAEAELYADDSVLKANAARAKIRAYHQSGLRAREFDAINNFLTRYPSHADFGKLTDRQYEIADEFAGGHRDPAYHSLRFIPWLTGEDRSIEMYEKAVKNAPFSQRAPAGKLALARALISQKGKAPEAVKVLRGLIKDHPDYPNLKFAYLELGNALYEMSRLGDGDGRYSREAAIIFEEFKRRYPDAPETGFVNARIERSKDIQAQRLLGIARFYHRNDRDHAAERYLSRVLQDFPDSVPADAAESLLSDIDRGYAVRLLRPELKPRQEPYKTYSLPDEDEDLLIVPENSGGRYLLPIRDLGLGRKDQDKKDQK